MAKKYYCPNCGETVLKKDKYCIKCGFQLDTKIIKVSSTKSKNVKKHTLSAKKIIIPVISAIVLAGAACFVFIFLPPMLKFQEAKGLISGGKYDEGYALLEELGNYNNAQDIILQSKYDRAVEKLANKEFDGAIDLFSEIQNYSDTSSKIKECNYEHGNSLFEDGQYSQAIQYYKQADDFSDAKTKIRNCEQYIKEKEYPNYYSLMKSYYYAGDFLNSFSNAKELPYNYKDSKYYKDKLTHLTSYNQRYDTIYVVEKCVLGFDNSWEKEVDDGYAFFYTESSNYYCIISVGTESNADNLTLSEIVDTEKDYLLSLGYNYVGIENSILDGEKSQRLIFEYEIEDKEVGASYSVREECEYALYDGNVYNITVIYPSNDYFTSYSSKIEIQKVINSFAFL